MTVFEVLSLDHQSLLEACLSLERNEGESVTHRLEWYNRLAREWAQHARLEETILYPRLAAIPETMRLAQKGLLEHESIHRSFQELESIPADDDRWVPDFEDLREQIRNHIDDEEAELFKKIRKVFSPGELKHLSDEMCARHVPPLAA